MSISLVLAMILASSVMIYAKSDDNKDVTEQKAVISTDATSVKPDEVKQDEVKPTDATKAQPTADEIQAKLEKDAAKLGITVDELKAKLESANTTDIKDKLSKLREAFKTIKKDSAAKKALLAEIAKAKQEAKNEIIDVFIKGESVNFDVPPIVKNDHTLIPVRAIMDKFGATIAWDEATSTVTITKDDTVIKLVIGSNVALVNGTEVKLDVPAEVKDNRTLVPIRFIAETLKQKVEYDDASKTITIDEPDPSDTTSTSTPTTDTPTDTATDIPTDTTTDIPTDNPADTTTDTVVTP